MGERAKSIEDVFDHRALDREELLVVLEEHGSDDLVRGADDPALVRGRILDHNDTLCHMMCIEFKSVYRASFKLCHVTFMLSFERDTLRLQTPYLS